MNVRMSALSVVIVATPLRITGLWASSIEIVHRGAAAMLRTLRDRPPLLNHSSPACHIPQTGMRCGMPSADAVATQ